MGGAGGGGTTAADSMNGARPAKPQLLHRLVVAVITHDVCLFVAHDHTQLMCEAVGDSLPALVLLPSVQVFFCKYNDPIYVKMEKLEIMIKLANDKNIDQVLLEFKEYAQEVDVDFVRKVSRRRRGSLQDRTGAACIFGQRHVQRTVDPGATGSS